MFRGGKVNGTQAMRIKVNNIEAPEEPSGPMEASFFVSSWNVHGVQLVHIKADQLLPLGFDIYVLGVQNCVSLVAISKPCNLFLNQNGEYVEFSYLMTGERKLNGSLGIIIFVRKSLVDKEAMIMTKVNQIRDRRLSVLPTLQESASIQLVDQLNETANGGAVTMCFNFFDTKILIVNVKQNCVGELNEILSRVNPENFDHVLLMGDFGKDVLENSFELSQRLYVENFGDVPQEFASSRYFVVTRSSNKAAKVEAILHGHYSLTKLTSAVFSAMRISGDSETAPPPPFESSPSNSPRESFAIPGPPTPRGSRQVSYVVPPPPELPSPGLQFDESEEKVPTTVRRVIKKVPAAPPACPDTRKKKAPAPPADSDSSRGCFVCSKQIPTGQLMEVLDRRYHRNCMVCDVTGNRIMANFYVVDGRLMCQEAYDDVNNHQLCGVCNKQANLDYGKLIKTTRGVFHVDCFKCLDCNKSLATLDPSGSKLLSSKFVFSDEGFLYCEEHSSRLTCSRCNERISAAEGLAIDTTSGTEYYHKDCFTCTTCTTPISQLGGQYALHNGKVYCNDDYVKALGIQCSLCDQFVFPGTSYVESEGDAYHSACFEKLHHQDHVEYTV